MLKIWVEQLISLAAALLMVTQGVGGTSEDCVLCNELPIHAPCLVSLTTGEVTELAIYEPDPEIVGELSPVQDSETFSFIHCGNARGYLDTFQEIVVMSLPENAEHMKTEYFCSSCLELLAEYFEEGFVLADMYVPGYPVLYPISKGAHYMIRCYDIEIDALRKITVTGMLT